MKTLKWIFVAMIFVCLIVGAFLVLFNKILVSKKKNTQEVVTRKTLKLKLIGYVFFMLAFAFLIFQSLI